MSTKTWQCFHCGDVFRNPKHAAAHFGMDELAEPGCVAVLRHGESYLLDRIRDLEEQLERYRAEDSDIMRWHQTKLADHARALTREEERGYAKGLKDISIAAAEEMKQLREALRAQVIGEAKGANGPVMWCDLCESEWPHFEGEKHSADCLLNPKPVAVPPTAR